MGKERYAAYNGDEKYAFVSYAHADNGRVLPVIGELSRRRYRVWYDEGIEVGVNWPQKVAIRLKGSELVLLFLSEAFLRSQNCMRELNYAVAQRRRMLCVLLDDVSLPEDTAMQLATVEKLDAATLSATELVTELLRRGLPDETFLGDGVTGYERENAKAGKSGNPWRLVSILFALLFLGVSVLLYGYINGWFRAGVHRSEETVVREDGSAEQLLVTTWSDPVTRDLMLRSTNDSVIYLCGNASLNIASEIRFDGVWRAGSQAVENGGLKDLSPLSGKELTHLAVVCQQLTDIREIQEFKDLVYLDLSGNEIVDLSPLQSLKKLETLKIEHIAANDLAVLKELPSLKYVFISEEMCPYVSILLDESFDVILKK